MDKAKISWSIKNVNNTYDQTNDYYCGTYIKGVNTISVDIRIWNNRYGTSAVETANNIKLFLSFSNQEDNSLLKYISVATNSLQGDITETVDGATVTFIDPINLSGIANNGSEQDNPNNFIDMNITFDYKGTLDLKNNDFKNLFIKVVY